MKNRIVFLLLTLTCLTHGALRASEPEVPHISVEGVADIEVAPDVLNWSVVVTSRGPETEKVAQQQDAAVSAALKTIREAGIASEDIQTSYTSLGENWVYSSGSSFRDGYISTTSISFKSQKHEQYRPLWFRLSKLSGVSIKSAYWDTSERIALRKKARTQAIQAARAKAEAMAADAGVSLLEPLAIEEVQASPYFGNYNSNSIIETNGKGSDETSVSEGKIKVTAHVSMRFRIGSR